MADTLSGTSIADMQSAAHNASNNTPDSTDPFDHPAPGLVALFSDFNDSILAMRQLLEEAIPTDLGIVLTDALQMVGLRCQIGLKLASDTPVEYTPTDTRILHPHTAALCGF